MRDCSSRSWEEDFMLRAALSLAVLVATMNVAPAQTESSRLKGIAASKTIKLAHRTDATPFSFVNEKNEITGYTVDICKLVVASLQRQLKLEGLKIEWTPVTTLTRFDTVASGKADMECGASTVTLGRMNQVDFSNYIFVESTGLAVKTTAGINVLQDIANKKIAVIAGTSNEKAFAAMNQQMQLKAAIVPVKNREEAIAALENGTADGFASDKLLLAGTQYKDAQSMKLLPDDLSIEPYAIALPRGDWGMRLAVNTALAEIYRSGQAVYVFDRWFAVLGMRPGFLLSAVYVLGAISE